MFYFILTEETNIPKQLGGAVFWLRLKNIFCIIHFMKPKKRQKLCSNCDGEIDLDVIVCPYCAADLREEKPEQQLTTTPARPLNGTQMSESLYPSSFPVHEESEVPPEKEAVAESLPSETEENPHLTLQAALLFSVGVQLFILGFLLVLFSHQGSVLLKWDARLWFLYVFASIPFLIFGYRSLTKL